MVLIELIGAIVFVGFTAWGFASFVRAVTEYLALKHRNDTQWQPPTEDQQNTNNNDQD